MKLLCDESIEYITDKCRDIAKEVSIIMYKNLQFQSTSNGAFLVDLTGVEPVSKNPFITTSPITDKCFDIPSSAHPLSDLQIQQLHIFFPDLKALEGKCSACSVPDSQAADDLRLTAAIRQRVLNYLQRLFFSEF